MNQAPCTCSAEIVLVHGCCCRPMGPMPVVRAAPASDNSWVRSPLARWAWEGDAKDTGA